MHYTDGCKGCGAFFEQQLGNVFFSVLSKIAKQLAQASKASAAITMIRSFNCKFKAQDFQFLSESLHIFPLLFRGTQSQMSQFATNEEQSSSNLITKCHSFYKENEEVSDLGKSL